MGFRKKAAERLAEVPTRLNYDVGKLAKGRMEAYASRMAITAVIYFAGEILVLVFGALATIFSAVRGFDVATTVFAALTTLLAGVNKVAGGRERWEAYNTAYHKVSEAWDIYACANGEIRFPEQKKLLLAAIREAEEYQYNAWMRLRQTDQKKP